MKVEQLWQEPKMEDLDMLPNLDDIGPLLESLIGSANFVWNKHLHAISFHCFSPKTADLFRSPNVEYFGQNLFNRKPLKEIVFRNIVAFKKIHREFFFPQLYVNVIVPKMRKRVKHALSYAMSNLIDHFPLLEHLFVHQFFHSVDLYQNFYCWNCLYVY